jgi:hypothetical protein
MPLLTTIAVQKTENRPACYKIDLTEGSKGKKKTKSAGDMEPALEKPLICSNCSAPITSGKEAVSVNGSHEHAFFNPAGIAFEIRCFKQAPGCLVQGDPTTEFSWFAGYRWQYATCGNCLTHLGWFFLSGNNSFFGLISDRVI